MPILLFALLGCPAPEVPPPPATGDGGDCAVENDDPVSPLPSWATWESSEREYGTGLGWGDFDGDGYRDLVVASGNDMRPGPIAVHLGREDGLLARDPEVILPVAAYHGHLAVGDVDRDGYDDVVVSRLLGEAQWGDPGGVDLYLGGPWGLSQAPVWTAEGFHSFSVALGDVDGDADLDLAVAVGEPYEAEPAPQRLYENDGGSFGEAPAWTSEDLAHALDVAFVDRDGDRDLDLVFARSGAPHAAYDNTDGALATVPSWQAAGEGFDGNTLDFGDVDGDGRADLLVSDNTYTGGAGVVRLYCGTGWAPCWTSDQAERPWSAVSLVDLDGDDDLDAVAGQWWGPVVAWSNVDGALSATSTAVTQTRSVVEAFAWHDLDASHEEQGCIEAQGLISLPKGARVLSIEPPDGVVGDGYVSATGPVSVEWSRSRQPDLAISNWDADVGTWLFERQAAP